MQHVKGISHAPGCKEAFSLLVRRVYHSFGYAVLYLSVLCLNLGLIIWLIKDKGHPEPLDIFVLLEFAVSGALVLEIVYSVKTKGIREWVSDLANWFDFLVALVCVLSLGAYAIGEELQEEVAVGVASARYIAQTLRLGVLLRHARRKNTQGIAEFEQVRFDINWEAEANENRSQNDSLSPQTPYWGRGRAYSSSPVFYNPSMKKNSIAPEVDTPIVSRESDDSQYRDETDQKDSKVRDETDPLMVDDN